MCVCVCVRLCVCLCALEAKYCGSTSAGKERIGRNRCQWPVAARVEIGGPGRMQCSSAGSRGRREAMRTNERTNEQTNDLTTQRPNDARREPPGGAHTCTIDPLRFKRDQRIGIPELALAKKNTCIHSSAHKRLLHTWIHSSGNGGKKVGYRASAEFPERLCLRVLGRTWVASDNLCTKYLGTYLLPGRMMT